MEDISNLYNELLNVKLNNIEKEKKRQYDSLFNNLVEKGMVHADIHVEMALEMELNFFKNFIEYAIIQFKELKNEPVAKIYELEKVYKYGIDKFFSNSLQRMISIINNVRSSINEEFAMEPLEKIRAEAIQKLESVKELKSCIFYARYESQ
ncbi:MAG: hypothetical protein HXY47_04910 [Nitrospirae bacterium]|nr:hypothetical protein [Nitrospirota bacterium]